MPELLLEVGTEEMPAVILSDTIAQFKASASKAFEEARLAFEMLEVFATPRRLVLHVEGLAERQDDIEKIQRGPSIKAAYDNANQPTKALEGFLRGQGVNISSVTREGDYVYIKKQEIGRSAFEVLTTLLPEHIRNLNFPKFMRWGEAKMRFVRPLRWVTALLDGTVIPFEIEEITSGKFSRGHRFISPDNFEVSGWDDYSAKLKKSAVMLNQDERRELIKTEAVEVSSSVGAIFMDDELLDENVFLVEHPAPLLGKFDESFLELPDAVLITAMKKHQKFFPIKDKSGRLQPYFVAVRNGFREDIDTVREGNEWVLAARFNDAKFFFEEDAKTTLEQFAEKLDRIIFQVKLGTMQAKVERIGIIVEKLAEHIGWEEELRQEAQTAVRLCKADLSSGMVTELPSLQGVIGGVYAMRDGLPENIATAIEEHYKPKSAFDGVSSNNLARAIAITDRADTLVGYLGLGYMPTGSSDPFALRRASQGIIEIAAHDPDYPDVNLICDWAMEAYQSQKVELKLDEELNQNLTQLLQARVLALLEFHEIRYDIARAVIGGGWTQKVQDIVSRAQALQKLSAHFDWNTLVNASIRPSNILIGARKTDIKIGSKLVDVKDHLLVEEQEIVLFETAAALSPDITRAERFGDYQNVFTILLQLAEPIHNFFDKVMVMDEDIAKRTNRLTLMAGLEHLFRSLADFTQIVVDNPAE